MSERRCSRCNHHDVQHRPVGCRWPVGSRYCGCAEYIESVDNAHISGVAGPSEPVYDLGHHGELDWDGET